MLLSSQSLPTKHPSSSYQVSSYHVILYNDSHMITIHWLYLLIDNVSLNVATVPGNIRLDNSSTPTLINITWDMAEGVSPALVTYEVTYSLSRIDGSSEDQTLKVKSNYISHVSTGCYSCYCYWQTSNNYFVLMDQLPETTVNVSVIAYISWYSSAMSPVVTIVSDSRCELLLCIISILYEDCGMGIVI